VRRTFATGIFLALMTSSVATAGTSSRAAPEPVAIATTRGALAALRPTIYQWPIPFGPTRGREMAAYSLRHYGEDTYTLEKPKVIVEQLTRWLRCTYAITLTNVIGHNESLSSPYHRERVASLRVQTHSDWNRVDMHTYRTRLAQLRCPAGSFGGAAQAAIQPDTGGI
jgi:hypothetical protein